MNLETLAIVAVQSGALFLFVWLLFRVFPAVPANAKAWIWRLAFLKPLLGLMPFAVLSLYVLPERSVAPQQTGAILISSDPVIMNSATTPETTSVVRLVEPWLLAWVAGAALVAIIGGVNWLRIRRIVRSSRPITNIEVERTLALLADRACVQRPIELRTTEKIQTAMLVSGFRTVILLPNDVIENGANEDVRLMLAHEVAHIARRDIAWFGLSWVVQCLFFFNPLVWVAARSSRLDHESATDQYASQLADVSIQTYAEMLLRATVVARTSLVPGALPMGESYRTIHRRLEAMNHFQVKPSRWNKPALGLLALVTLGLLPVYQLAEAKSQQSTAQGQAVPSAPPVQASGTQIPVIKTAEGASTLAPAVSKAKKKAKKKIVKPGRIQAAAGMPIATRSREKSAIGISIPYQHIAPAQANSVPGMAARSIAPAVEATTRPAQIAQPNASDRIVALQSSTPLPGEAINPQPDQRIGMVAGVGEMGAPTTSPNSVPFDSTAQGISVPGARPGGFGPAATAPMPGSMSKRTVGKDALISIKIQDADIRQILSTMFHHVDKNYVIEPEVSGVLSMGMDNVPFEKALNAILKAVKATYRVEGGIYIISKRAGQK